MRTPGNGNSGPTKSTQRRGRGPWAESPCATSSRIRVFETRVPSTGSISTFLVLPSTPSRTTPDASGQTPPLCLWNFRPRSPPPDAIGFAVPDQAGGVLSVVHRLFHHDGLF